MGLSEIAVPLNPLNNHHVPFKQSPGAAHFQTASFWSSAERPIGVVLHVLQTSKSRGWLRMTLLLWKKITSTWGGSRPNHMEMIKILPQVRGIPNWFLFWEVFLIVSNLVCPDRYGGIWKTHQKWSIDHIPGWESYSRICMSGNH